MENTPKHIELFDKYALGTLSKEEKTQLDEMLENSPELKLEFKSHQLLVEGIKEARKQELKDYIKENGEVLYFQNIWGDKWKKASAAIVLIFACAFFLVEYLTQKNKNQSGLAFEDNKEKKEEVIEEKENESNYQKKNLEKEEFEEAVFAEVEDLETTDSLFDFHDEIAPKPPMDDMEVASTENKEVILSDISIAKEVKLLDTALLINYANAVVTLDKDQVRLAAKKSTKATLSTRTSDVVLNKEEKESEGAKDKIKVMENDTIEQVQGKEKQIAKTMAVEFWKSPLNFKGYKYQNNTLILYGVSANEVKIISYNNRYYLKMDKGVCEILGSSEYLPFAYITDKTILNQLNGY